MNMGPRIVRDGLYLCLDAALPQSNNGGINLMDNGLGFSGNNYNFTNYTFDTVDDYNPSGSFRYSGAESTATTNNYIPVNTGDTYFLSCFAKAGETNGSGYYSQNNQYFGIACYDADLNYISNHYCSKVGAAIDTTLAAPLISGDTTITLNNGNGWSSTSGVVNYNRQMQWWPYTNNKGYTYPNYTYTRNTSKNNTFYNTNGCWSSRTGNILYLTQPWPGPDLVSGTAVSNGSDGATYNYNVLSNQALTSGWVQYTGYIGGINSNRNTNANEFRQGTEYVRIVALRNYRSTPVTPSDATLRYSDIIFRKISGNTFTDLSKNKNNGSLKKSVVYDTRFNPSYWFNGVSDYIDFGTASRFLPLQNHALEVWFKSAGAAPNMSAGGLLFVHYGLYIRLRTDGRITYNVIGYSGVTILTVSSTNASLHDNKWHHVVCTLFNNISYGIYIDGQLQLSGTPNQSWDGTSQYSGIQTLLGNDLNNIDYYYRGWIGAARIYNIGLTSAQVLQNYNATKGRFGL